MIRISIGEVRKGGVEMSALAEASWLVRQAAEPRPVGDSVKAAIRRAAHRLGFSYSRTKDIWYADARRIDAHEMDALRRKARERDQEEIARVEAVAAVDRLVALREALAQADENFNQPYVAALDDVLRSMGCPVGTMAIRKE